MTPSVSYSEAQSPVRLNVGFSILESSMNYKRQYDLLMEKAKQRGKVEGYKECHHIVPRCMGGSNKKENLVELTAREHYLAHRLLYMHYKTPQMAYAWSAMTRVGPQNERLTKANDFEKIREAVAKVGHSEEARKKMRDAKLGKPRSWTTSEETKEKIRKSMLGKKASDESRRKMSEKLKGRIPWNKGLTNQTK